MWHERVWHVHPLSLGWVTSNAIDVQFDAYIMLYLPKIDVIICLKSPGGHMMG